jgi:hypothetical protein
MGARRWMRHVSMSVVAVVVAVAVPTAAQADPDTQGLSRVTVLDPGDGWISLQNWNSGLFLAVAGSSNANGAKVIQYNRLSQPDGQPIPDQDWLLVGRGNGYFSLRNAGTPDWKALAVAGHSTTSSAKVIQYTYQPSNTDQQWYFHQLAGGSGIRADQPQQRPVSGHPCRQRSSGRTGHPVPV